MLEAITLNNLYDLTNGVFTDLNALGVPWASKNIQTQLDIAYIGNHSGQKQISPMLRQFVENGEISSANRATVAGVLIALYNDNWAKEYATLSAEYNPIENYSMVEQMTNDKTEIEYGRTDTSTSNNEHSIEGSESFIHNTSDKTTGATSETKSGSEIHRPIQKQENNVYAFTSPQNGLGKLKTSEVVNSGTDTTDYNDVKNTTTQNNETKTTGSDTTQYNDRKDIDNGGSSNVASGKDTHTRNYRLTRSGNIGVTTSQQMLQSERDLWLWNFFESVVFPDIDRALTIGIY